MSTPLGILQEDPEDPHLVGFMLVLVVVLLEEIYLGLVLCAVLGETTRMMTKSCVKSFVEEIPGEEVLELQMLGGFLILVLFLEIWLDLVVWAVDVEVWRDVVEWAAVWVAGVGDKSC
jgi:hypothetical protein